MFRRDPILLPQQVAQVGFSPDGDTFFITQPRTVTVSTATQGANIRYTVNGSPPTATSGVPIGNHGTVSITPSTFGTTLQAIAFEAGMSDSYVYSATYFYEHDSGTAPGGMDNSMALPPGGGGPVGGGDGTDAGMSGPTYDRNGNLKTYNGWTYTYDAQNRLTGASNGTHTATFYYDGKNRQIARVIGSVIRFSVWDDWELIEEYGGARTAAYVQGAHGVIRALMNNTYYYYYQDSLGSTTHVANAAGQLLESYRYDLYGTPVTASAYGITDLYAGERWIPELGLYDLRNRFMSPDLGRFLQADPIGFKGDGSNLYRYCHNDPADFSDPTGLIDRNSNFFWNTACFFDSGNSFQGGYNEFMGYHPQAGMGDNASAGPSISGKDEGAKVHFAPSTNPIHYQPDVYRNNQDGTTTRAGSKTVAELSVEQQSGKEATVHLAVHEYYALSPGPNFKKFAENHEHKDNVQPILDWYRSGTTQLKAMAVRPQATAEGFKQAVDNAIRPSFDSRRNTLQIRADVLGLHIPRYPNGRMIPYNE